MSTEAITTVVAPPPDLGKRVPPVLPEDLCVALGRLLQYVKADEVKAVLLALTERYAAAEKRRESFEVTVIARGHDGKHREFRWNEDRRLGP